MTGHGVRQRFLRLGAVVCAFALAMAVSAQDAEEPSVVSYLRDSGIAIDLDPSGRESPTFEDELSGGTIDGVPRCVLHEFSTPGQGLYLSGSGLYLSGSVGGMVLGDPIVLTDENGDETYELPTEVEASLPQAGAYDGALHGVLAAMVDARVVTIFVVDDFAHGEFQIPDLVFPLVGGDVDELVLKTAVQGGSFSHGALVLHHLNSLVLATGLFDINASNLFPEHGYFEWLAGEGRWLIVRAVDVSSHDPSQHLTADLVASAIERAVTGNYDPPGSATNPATKHYVINMSWVLLPCATVELFLSAPDAFDSWEKYLYSLDLPLGSPLFEARERDIQNNTTEYIEEMTRLLAWVPPSNPLHALLNTGLELPDGVGWTAVAAAGNFHLPYQMLPAAWPFVIGVGSPHPDGLSVPQPPFSNYPGDVLSRGAWFRLRPLVTSGYHGGVGHLSYAGTSFSAPFIAFDIARRGLP